MIIWRRLPIVVGIAAILGGCAHNPGHSPEEAELSLAVAREKDGLFRELREENRKILQAFNGEATRFYEETSDAYFIIGYEYYILAKEWRERGDEERANVHAVRAKIYKDVSEDLRAAAEARRQAALGSDAGSVSDLNLAPTPSSSLGLPGAEAPSGPLGGGLGSAFGPAPIFGPMSPPGAGLGQESP
jgi:hypothetical protein